MFDSTSRCLCMQYMYRFTHHIKVKCHMFFKAFLLFNFCFNSSCISFICLFLLGFFNRFHLFCLYCLTPSVRPFDAITQLVLSLTPRLVR